MLRHNTNLFLVICFLAFTLSLPDMCFAQVGNEHIDQKDYGSYEAEDEHDISELEGQLNDFKKTQSQLLKDMTPAQVKLQQKLQKAIEGGDQKQIQAVTQELAKSYQSTATAGQMTAMVNMALKQFQTMSEPDLRAHILQRTAGNPIGVLLTNYPKTLDYLVKVLRDPLALPQFFSILTQKTKLMIFFGLNIFLFILNFFQKRVHKNTKASGATHFKRWLFFFGVRLALFIGFFHTEVGPFFFIAKDTFL